jgi:hypothetical protein
MERLSVSQCRALIDQEDNESLSDQGVGELRDMLYALGGVIADAYADLDSIDQSTFEPPNDLDDWFREIGLVSK